MIGVFTTVKVVNGNPLFFEQHQKRLTAHAKKLNLGSFSLNKLIIKKYLQENNLSDCALKITITKENKHTSVTMQHRLLPDPSDVKLITVTDTRAASKTLKTTDRTINEQAKKLAVANGADDAVFVQNNKLIESTIANIFSINHQGQIITPPLEGRGLKGIIRKMIMQNLDVVEEEIPENTTSPLVLTNSLRIQKVTHLNGKKLQDAEKLFQCIKKIKNSLEGKYIDKMRVRENSFFKQLSTWLEPEKVFLTLFKNAPSSFWLDSSLTNDFSRYSYMGIPSEEISYSLKANLVTVKKNGTNKRIHQNIFDYLTEQLKLEEIKTPPLPFPFVGGYVGYFGYELKVLTGAKTKYQSPYPDSLWYKVNNFIAFDHQEKKVYLVSLKNNPAWFTKIEQALKKITQVKNTKNIHQKITFKLTRDKNRYLKDIQKCKEYLQKGESYQICLTNSLTAKAKIDPLSLYLNLRTTNPAPYSAFLKNGDLAILCSSPEEFLKIDHLDNVETKPIKGTIKRGGNKTTDKKLVKELLSSKKDWSENSMIVDLLRNDLGKVCKFGTVKVKKLMAIESYQTVHQLVSTVVGKLKNDKTIIDCIKACFPGGSMTGAPKIKTMEIIESLENKARGVYSGAIGFLSFNQAVALNIVIRTMIIKNDNLSIGAGGAILMDSDPEKEYDEMILKTKAIVEAAGAKLYTKPMHTVFLALGSNIGNKKEQINSAVKLLGQQIKNIQLAKFYETKPMYYEDQEDFLNTALKGETELSPEELLKFVKTIEKKLGRQKRFRNGPREIDIDILFYDDLILNEKNLIIPHPQIPEREFVLKPLMDMAPDFIHPVLQKSIHEILKHN